MITDEKWFVRITVDKKYIVVFHTFKAFGSDEKVTTPVPSEFWPALRQCGYFPEMVRTMLDARQKIIKGHEASNN